MVKKNYLWNLEKELSLFEANNAGRRVKSKK